MHRKWISLLFLGLAGCGGGGGGGGAPNPPPMTTIPTVSINDLQIAEGNNGPSIASLTVTLSATSSAAVSLNFRAENGTAVVSEDYLTTSGTLTIPVGQRTATIAVSVSGDTTFEPDETFKLLLADATNATLSDAEGVITITNDDLDATAAYKTVIKRLRADLLAVLSQQQSFGQVFEMDLDADGDIDLIQLNTRNAEETK